MKKRLFAVLLFAFLSIPLSLVLAQDSPRRVFSQMDGDKDGKVTRDEFATFHMDFARRGREARFNQLDTNKDGKITKDEFMAIQLNEAQRIGNARFGRIDANKDGVLTEQEVTRRFRLIKDTMEQLK